MCDNLFKRFAIRLIRSLWTEGSCLAPQDRCAAENAAQRIRRLSPLRFAR